MLQKFNPNKFQAFNGTEIPNWLRLFRQAADATFQALEVIWKAWGAG
jgi:hypothetical protein